MINEDLNRIASIPAEVRSEREQLLFMPQPIYSSRSVSDEWERE